jgi:prepilin-type N-terminal cleavage/methylation domain-containing protein
LRRGGLTLIEVVAAIAILGAILVGIVLAKARHTHQLALARQRIGNIHLGCFAQTTVGDADNILHDIARL